MAILSANERLRKYIDEMGGGNVSQIESKIGKSNGYIKNTKSYSLDVLNLLAELFPNLNMNWLITGKGSMVIAQTKTPPPAKANEGVNLAIDSEYVISLLENLKSGQEFIYSSLDKVRSHLELNAKPLADKRTLDDAAKQVAIERERIAAGGGKRNKVSSSAKSVQDNKE